MRRRRSTQAFVPLARNSLSGKVVPSPLCEPRLLARFRYYLVRRQPASLRERHQGDVASYVATQPDLFSIDKLLLPYQRGPRTVLTETQRAESYQAPLLSLPVDKNNTGIPIRLIPLCGALSLPFQTS